MKKLIITCALALLVLVPATSRADEGMWRVIGDKAAEADLVCHPASQTSIPSPGPDIPIPVAEQATDTLASEGGDVQLIRELFLYCTRGRIIDKQTVCRADPVQAILIEEALYFGLVQDEIVIYEGLGGAGIKVDEADFVKTVADKKLGITQTLYELETRPGTVGPYGLDISGSGIKYVNAVVARREDKVAVRSDASPEWGERRGLRHVGNTTGGLVILQYAV